MYSGDAGRSRPDVRVVPYGVPLLLKFGWFGGHGVEDLGDRQHRAADGLIGDPVRDNEGAVTRDCSACVDEVGGFTRRSRRPAACVMIGIGDQASTCWGSSTSSRIAEIERYASGRRHG